MELDSVIIMRRMKDRYTIDFTVYRNGLVRGRYEDDSWHLNDYEFTLLNNYIWNDYWNLFHYSNDYEDDFPALFINLKYNKITNKPGRLVKIDNWQFEDGIVRIVERAKDRRDNNE